LANPSIVSGKTGQEKWMWKGKEPSLKWVKRCEKSVKVGKTGRKRDRDRER
jgi:hypothetical protein